MANKGYTFLLIWIIQFITISGRVPLEEFFPFGIQNGDSRVPPNDDSFVQVALQHGFPFFNNTYRSLFVNTNGAISFIRGVSQFTPQCIALSQPMIAPFWSDIDTRIGGDIFYRESLDRTLLAKATSEISRAFPQFWDLSLGWAFIATWSEVPFFGASNLCNGTSLRNTFQIILGTDGVYSFTIFKYNNITWTTGTASGGNCTGLGGNTAKIGFDVGDLRTLYEVPKSCSAEIINITETSNVNLPGQWIFRVDDVFVSLSCEESAVARNSPQVQAQQRLRITPSFVSILGQVPIQIQGPCITNVTTIFCKFYQADPAANIVVRGRQLTNRSVECVVPYLNSYGRIQVDLNFTRILGNGTVVQEIYSGFVYSVESTQDLIVISLDEVDSSGNLAVNMTWNPTQFEDSQSRVLSSRTRSEVINIGVVGAIAVTPRPTPSVTLDLYVVKNVYGVWVEKTKVLENVRNTGQFAGNFTRHLNTTGPVIFKLVPNVNANFIGSVGRSISAIDERAAAAVRVSAFSSIRNTENMSPQAAIIACDLWYRSDPGLPLASNASGILPCPPLFRQALEDERFAIDTNSNAADLEFYHPGAQFVFLQRSPNPNGAGQECVYKDGRIMAGPLGGGSSDMVSPSTQRAFPQHFIKDVAPWLWCCKYSNNLASCRKYYEKRPSDTGSNYVPSRPIRAAGDPHITTFDLASYTFNGVGEYWMIKSVNFSMQARMEQYRTSNGTLMQASVFTAFVMQQETFASARRVHVQIATKPSGLSILVDGESLELPEGISISLNIPGVQISIDSTSKLSLSFSTGFTITFTTADENTALNIVGSANVDLMNKISGGLLGYFDGNSANDLKIPNGTIIPLNSTIEDIHYKFGMKWLISAEESLFQYSSAKSYFSYYNPTFAPNFTPVDISIIPDHVLQTCQNVTSCLYDYASTGSLTLANSTREVQVNFIQTVQELMVRSEMCPAIIELTNGYFKADNFFIGSNITFGCGYGFKLLGSKYLVCQKVGGVLKWNGEIPVCQGIVNCGRADAAATFADWLTYHMCMSDFDMDKMIEKIGDMM